MVSFDETLQQLQNLHTGSQLMDAEDAIKITANRGFIVPEGFNTTIAFEGDVNSQIIKFECPKYWEGHDLSKCDYIKLLWINTGNNFEGETELKILADNEDNIILGWLVPPEVFAKKGEIELSISIYDLDENNRIAFAWNTSVLKQLQIGTSIQQVSVKSANEEPSWKIPARDEILTINPELRTIVAPIGYNYNVANYGEAGMSIVHFQIPKYFNNHNIMDAEITVFFSIGTYSGNSQGVNKNIAYSEDSQGEGLVYLDWEIPESVTTNSDLIDGGNFAISITFSWEDKKVLRTSLFNGLKIGKSLVESAPFKKLGGQYYIVGNECNDDPDLVRTAGISSIRDNHSADTIKLNELMLDIDINGEIQGLMIGTEEDQPVEEAQRVSGIITVRTPPEKPTSQLYRVLKPSFVRGQQRLKNWEVIVVDSISNVKSPKYFNLAKNQMVFYYTSDTERPVRVYTEYGWLYFEDLYGIPFELDLNYSGRIYNIKDNDPSGDKLNILAEYKLCYYSKSKRDWEYIDTDDFDASILNAIELPDLPSVEKFYCLTTAQFVQNARAIDNWNCIVVNEVPYSGKEFISDIRYPEAATITAYYELSTKTPKVYLTSDLSEALGMQYSGWVNLASLSSLLSTQFNVQYGGVKTSGQPLEENKYYILLDCSLHFYKEGQWHHLAGASGSGKNAEVFNSITNLASGDYAHAEGYGTKASGMRAHAEGYITTASGNYSHAEGENTVASKDGAHAEGYGAAASNYYSHAEGQNTKASGKFSHAEGDNAYATEEAAHAEGYNTRAHGKASHAEGYNTVAYEKYTHAEGYQTTANRTSTHAEGYNTLAGYDTAFDYKDSDYYHGQCAHAEGEETKAINYAAHTEGQQTLAAGIASHAGGKQSSATGHRSFTHGYYVNAKETDQFVVGRFNKDNSNALFMVGCGNNESRRNAFEVISTDAGVSLKVGNTVITEAQLIALLSKL